MRLPIHFRQKEFEYQMSLLVTQRKKQQAKEREIDHVEYLLASNRVTKQRAAMEEDFERQSTAGDQTSELEEKLKKLPGVIDRIRRDLPADKSKIR